MHVGVHNLFLAIWNRKTGLSEPSLTWQSFNHCNNAFITYLYPHLTRSKLQLSSKSSFPEPIFFYFKNLRYGANKSAVFLYVVDLVKFGRQ